MPPVVDPKKKAVFLAVKCRSCGAKAGSPCVSKQAGEFMGESIEMKDWVHPKRVNDAKRYFNGTPGASTRLLGGRY